MKNNFTKEFLAFLKEYKVVSVAMAFVMGSAATNLTNSLVKDILMPMAEPLMSGEKWREAVLSIGSVQIAYGSFLAELINFITLTLIIFLIVRKLLKLEEKELH